jgi:plastocyanin
MMVASAEIVALAVSVLCGDLTGHAMVTKRLTKKAPATATYNLRGAVLPDPAERQVSEFDRMVVILEGGKGASKTPETSTIAQRSGRFDPDLLIVPAGSTIQFPNFDPIFHNVFSLSHAKTFDLGYYAKGQTRSITFPAEGIVQVYCHIHANMYAAIVVTASPWYSKVGADGSFGWSNLPPGHYTVTLWHKVAGMFKSEVDIPESGTADVVVRVPIDTGERH